MADYGLDNKIKEGGGEYSFDWDEYCMDGGDQPILDQLNILEPEENKSYWYASRVSSGGYLDEQNYMEFTSYVLGVSQGQDFSITSTMSVGSDYNDTPEILELHGEENNDNYYSILDEKIGYLRPVFTLKSGIRVEKLPTT